MTARTSSILGKRNTKDALQFGERIRELKSLIIETASTVDAGNGFAVDFAQYGITTIQAVQGFKHTTDNSVVVTENPTTAVSSSVLLLTVPAGTDDDKRVYQIFYT